MTEYALTDADGTVRWRGTIDPPPGGGSQPGALCSAERLFTEQATAGTYTATLDMLAGSVVIDVLVYLLVWPWGLDPGTDSLALKVGDSATPGGYYNDVDLLGFASTEYGSDMTNQGCLSLGSQRAGDYRQGSYGSDPNGNAAASLGVRYADDDTITATITTTSVAPVTPSGLLLVKVLYFAPVTADDAAFVATP